MRARSTSRRRRTRAASCPASCCGSQDHSRAVRQSAPRSRRRSRRSSTTTTHTPRPASRADEWLTLGGSYRRAYFNPRERALNKTSADNLIVKWQYLTSGMISAQPVVTWVDLPGEGRTQIVIVPSWDGYVNAVRADNG